MEDSGILNPLNSKPQGRCLTFFTPKKWIRTSSKSLFILKFKSTVLLSQNSYKIPKSPRSYVGEHASARGSPWGVKVVWIQFSLTSRADKHVWNGTGWVDSLVCNETQHVCVEVLLCSGRTRFVKHSDRWVWKLRQICLQRVAICLTQNKCKPRSWYQSCWICGGP